MASTSETLPKTQDFQFKDESGTQKLARKTKDSPFMVAGLTGCTIAAAYGVYRFKNRGKMSASNYLMQLRVVAQGTVLTCLCVGVCVQLYKHLTKSPSSSEKE